MQNNLKVRKVPVSTQKYLKVRKSTWKYTNIPESGQKYLKVRKSTWKYAEVRGSYLKECKST